MLIELDFESTIGGRLGGNKDNVDGGGKYSEETAIGVAPDDITQCRTA